MDRLKALGTELARLRKARGYSQQDVAAWANITPGALSRFESGQGAEFGLRKLLAVLEIFGLDLVIVPSAANSTPAGRPLHAEFPRKSAFPTRNPTP